ncbi:MAG: hypothetical protein Q8O84_01615 [Nanoarchaeota archaeon]|nr:hypothetical protein [Nanoarchaeota archaeon]
MEKNIKVKTKHVAPSPGYFEIDDGIHTYRLMENLSPSMTQNKLAEFYEEQKQKGNPLPLNSIQMIGLLEDTANSEDNELKNYVHRSLRNNWLNTLTGVIYNPAGQKDETIHNYGTSDAYSIIGDIVGNDNWIEKIDNPNALESLLKTNDIKKLNEISNKINKTPMYFWRVNSKPSKKTESAVRFYANDDRLRLDANWDLSCECPAFLVEKVER